jgi:hypothetical protein
MAHLLQLNFIAIGRISDNLTPRHGIVAVPSNAMVYDDAGNVTETHEHAGDFVEA